MFRLDLTSNFYFVYASIHRISCICILNTHKSVLHIIKLSPQKNLLAIYHDCNTYINYDTIKHIIFTRKLKIIVF